MTTSHWRLVAIMGALLSMGALFLPVFSGPSIESILGQNPNLFLGYRTDGIGPQSWLGTGRGEQILFLLSSLSCFVFAAMRRFRALRWATLSTLALLFLGVFLTANRMRRVISMAQFDREFAGEFGQHPSFVAPIVRWTPQMGLIVLLVGAVLLTLSASQLAPPKRSNSEQYPATVTSAFALRPILQAISVFVMGICGLGFWHYKASQVPASPSPMASNPGFPSFPPGMPVPPHLRAPGSSPFQNGAPQINGPTTMEIPRAKPQLSSAHFSPGSRFVAASYGKEWMIWDLKTAPLKLKPMFRVAVGGDDGEVRKPLWASEHAFRLHSSLSLIFDPKTKKWSRNDDFVPLYPPVSESAVARKNEQLSSNEAFAVIPSQAVVWKLFDSSEQGTQNEMHHNGRIALTSLPGGQVMPLPEEMRMNGELSDLTLAPRSRGAQLFAATHPSLFASKNGENLCRLRVFDVTGRRKLWEKLLPDTSADFQFSAGGSFLIGAGTPRVQPSDPNTRYNINGREVPASKTPPQHSGDGLDVWKVTSGQVQTRLNEKGIASNTLAVNGPQNAMLYFKSGLTSDDKPRLVARAVPSGKLLGRLEWPKTADLPRVVISGDGNQIALSQAQKIDLLAWKTLRSGTGAMRALVP